MSAIVSRIEVERSAEDVFAYATDPRTFHEWQKGVVSGHQNNTATSKVGTRCVTTRRIGMATRPITSEITELDPPHRWAIQGIKGPIRAHVEVTVEPLGDQRSELTISIKFHGHGIGRAIVPLFVVPEARREMPDNLQRLKQQLQTSR